MTTLRADLTALFAAAELTDVEVDAAIADEHVRSAAYRRVIAADSTDPRELAAVLARDPEPLTAKTAVVNLLDYIAEKTADPTKFQQQSADIVTEADRLAPPNDRAFVRQRVRDWQLWLDTENGQPPDAAALSAASDWMQRRLADFSASPQTLALLAEHARTKKTRNTAATKTNPRNP
ncbi:hypothetical protein [Amycolatopsis sp. Poz14]|uniref:hypothetical protein n=1 Tax=Amycolatopsis sp. Poz14 TaxID=1447705 RepID=UPI001EE7D03C|nr:hypothetical protein [Amycolatopsis sp. Poz14]MCG3752173.1 hypothetical protein [Amycolatopsis sp. Poz14]